MPALGWGFLLFATGLAVASLLFLRKNSRSKKITEEEIERIRERRAEVDAEEGAEDKEW